MAKYEKIIKYLSYCTRHRVMTSTNCRYIAKSIRFLLSYFYVFLILLLFISPSSVSFVLFRTHCPINIHCSYRWVINILFDNLFCLLITRLTLRANKKLFQVDFCCSFSSLSIYMFVSTISL